MAGKVVDKALSLLRTFPRVSLGNLKDMPGSKPHKVNRRRSVKKGNTHGRGIKGQGARGTLPRIGFEGNNTPFYLMIPKEPYYENHHLRKEYVPVSLLQLQRMIELNRVDSSEPLDLTSICNTGLIRVLPMQKQYGIHLTEEGADIFNAQINIEVQWVSELVIAAIERNGGTITTRFFDTPSLQAVVAPKNFFMKGIPIPKCKIPPTDVFKYYTDAKNRGYLANPREISNARLELAQKYGYELPNIKDDEKFEMLSARKDPRQIFYGLAPGWIVNLQDETVLKPKGKEHVEYYES
ncbi:39S ribosomal protein L15, mitochondrial-like [Mizuhopecten yessoensis]|uniref:Large ribosomal subunit protein uL15m n=1 Tax=Mizuhopecten yessoensis TaxID=6573 RepID=A0A210QBI5_MIZYE|nr:39S ribosomal protein L15, mitochondrial-like [Mizuhopecten yessoensis]OWF46094.1 39S ribosomal protein L15, mitochondrial [Mizuhopecten yessoensis]